MFTWSPADLLPGLSFLLLAALLLAALRRWYDPVPARTLAVFALVLLALFGPLLLGGKVLLPVDNLRGHVPFQHLPPTEPLGNLLQGDLIQLIAPAQAEVRRALAEGRWPLWNPHAGAGVPLLADPQAQALQPLQLATWFLPVPRAAGVTATLRVLLALLFSFLLLRRVGLQNRPGKRMGEGPALAGALAFGLGGFMIHWVGWPIATSAALLPALLYALLRLDQEGGRRDRFLLALVATTLLLGGHPETTATVLAFGLLTLLLQLRRRTQGTRLALLRDAALSLGIAFTLAAPALLPTFDALPDSLRAARLAEPLPDPSDDPAGRTFPARLVRRALLAVAPNAFGNSRYVHYWGPSNSNEDGGAFAGTAALLLAGLALLPSPGIRKPPGGAEPPPPSDRPASALPDAERSAPAVVGLWAGAAATALLLAARPPGLDPLLTAIPPLRALLTPRLLLFTGFGLAVLAAVGLERLRLENQTGARGPIRARLVAPLLLALALGALIAWTYLAHPDPQGLDRLAVFRDGWLRWQLRFLAAATLLLLLARGRRFLPLAAALLLAAELLLAHRPVNPPLPRDLAYPSDPALRFLQERLRDDSTGARIAALGRALPPNLSGLYGLPDARVYNPAAPLAYVQATAPLTARWWGEIPEWGNPTHPLYPRLGVRYLLTAPDTPLPPPLTPVFQGDTAWVYQIPNPRPALDRRHDRLTTTLYQDGHWRLLADRRPLPTSTSGDGPFLAARLPAEAHRLDLLYRPPPFLAGCLLAALGLASSLLAFLPPPRGLQ